MDPAADRPKRQAYKITDEETWARVRQAYLGGGMTAKECADRFDVSVHALRKRADTQAWSKRAFVNAVGPRAPSEAQPNDPYVIRRVARAPAPLLEVVQAEEATPCDPAELAEAAFARAAQAFAGGRSEEAGRLLKLAAAARKMADNDSAQMVAEVPAPEPDARAPALGDDELVCTVDQLFEATRDWAEEMLMHGVARLPAALVARAAIWRAIVLGEAAEAEDFAAAERGGWSQRLWTMEGEFYDPPTHRRLARLLWGRTLDGLPRMAQTPP